MTKLERLDDFLSEDARRFMMTSAGPFMPLIEDVYRVGTARKWYVPLQRPKM